MVGIPLLGLALISTQLVLASYFNNVALSAAVDAASTTALADGGKQSGTEAGISAVAALAPQVSPEISLYRTDSTPATWRAAVSFDSPILLFGQLQIVQSAEVVDENQ